MLIPCVAVVSCKFLSFLSILPDKVIFSVAVGAAYILSSVMIVKSLTLSRTTLPSLSASHPCTVAPLVVQYNVPASSTFNAPDLVKYVSPPDFTIKKESPLIATSNARFVVEVPPGSVILVVMAATVDPRPICLAFTPAVPVSAFEPLAADIV